VSYAAQRERRKTLWAENLCEKFPLDTQKPGQNSQKRRFEHENRVLFDDFVPLSSAPFLKKDFFDSFNGWR
jgi:hypothetical protein